MLTVTSNILTASLRQLGEIDPLTQQLRERMRQTHEHRTDENWFLPVNGVEISDTLYAHSPIPVTARVD